MSATPPAIHDLARRLLAGEPARAGPPDGEITPAARACETLRVPLAKLIGTAGFASLLARALSLAKRRAPALDGVRVEADGSLAGFTEGRPATGSPDAARHGGEVLVAELLGLLVTFIGEPLTLSVVRQAWPEASAGTQSPSTEETP